MTADRRVPPLLAPRTGDPLLVETLRDGLRGPAIGELAEYPADDVRFLFIDRTLSGDRLTIAAEAALHIIAVAVAAAGATGLDPSRSPPRVLSARSLRNSWFIVPFSPTCSSLISPSAGVMIRTPAKLSCL